MSVATPVQPNLTVDAPAAYKANIDAAIAAGWRQATWFAPHENDAGSPSVPDMTVRLEAGFVQTAAGLTEVAAQSTGTITAPASNPRKDLVVVDAADGAVSVIAGSESVSPSYPALTAGKISIAGITLATSTTAITNALIEDLRSWSLAPATEGEMQAGTETELRAMSPAGVAAAITAQAPGDQTARDWALQALMELDALNSSNGPQSYGTAVADAFEDESGIDTTASTGETFATGYYHNPAGYSKITTSGGSLIGNMSSSGGLAELFEGTTSRAASACARNADNAAGTGGYDWGSGNDKTVTRVVVYSSNDLGFNFSSGGTNSTTIKVQSSDDGSSWTDEATDTFNNASSLITRTIDFTPSGAHRYWRVEIDDATSSNYCAAELEFYQDNPAANMVLQSKAATIAAAAAPTEIRLQIDVEAVDALTLSGGSPDIALAASRDGNTTFTTITLEDTAAMSASDRKILKGTAVVSGQPSDTDIVVKLTVANNKAIRVHGWTIQADQNLTV